MAQTLTNIRNAREVSGQAESIAVQVAALRRELAGVRQNNHAELQQLFRQTIELRNRVEHLTRLATLLATTQIAALLAAGGTILWLIR